MFDELVVLVDIGIFVLLVFLGFGVDVYGDGVGVLVVV